MSTTHSALPEGFQGLADDALKPRVCRGFFNQQLLWLVKGLAGSVQTACSPGTRLLPRPPCMVERDSAMQLLKHDGRTLQRFVEEECDHDVHRSVASGLWEFRMAAAKYLGGGTTPDQVMKMCATAGLKEESRGALSQGQKGRVYIMKSKTGGSGALRVRVKENDLAQASAALAKQYNPFSELQVCSVDAAITACAQALRLQILAASDVAQQHHKQFVTVISKGRSRPECAQSLSRPILSQVTRLPPEQLPANRAAPWLSPLASPRSAETDTALAYGKPGADAGQLAEVLLTYVRSFQWRQRHARLDLLLQSTGRRLQKRPVSWLTLPSARVRRYNAGCLPVVLGSPDNDKKTEQGAQDRQGKITDLQVNVPPAVAVALLAGRAYVRPTRPETVFKRNAQGVPEVQGQVWGTDSMSNSTLQMYPPGTFGPILPDGASPRGLRKIRYIGLRWHSRVGSGDPLGVLSPEGEVIGGGGLFEFCCQSFLVASTVMGEFACACVSHVLASFVTYCEKPDVSLDHFHGLLAAERVLFSFLPYSAVLLQQDVVSHFSLPLPSPWPVTLAAVPNCDFAALIQLYDMVELSKNEKEPARERYCKNNAKQAMMSTPKPKQPLYKPLSSVGADKGFTPVRPKPKVSTAKKEKANGYDGPRPPKQAPPGRGPQPPKGPPPSSLVRPAEPAWPPRTSPAAPRQQSAAPTAKSVSWIEGLDSSSVLVQQGFPSSGPVVLHDPEIQEVMSDSSNILYELAEDAYEQLSLHHDTDWTQFPEVGEAVKSLGVEELALCVALCPGRAKWGVGIAGNQKKRTQAARLSLCLAVASESPELEAVCQSRPCWGEFYRTHEAELGVEADSGTYHYARNRKGPAQKGSVRRPKEPQEEYYASAYDTEEPDELAEEEGEPGEVEEEEVPVEEPGPWDEGGSEAQDEGGSEAQDEGGSEAQEPETWEPPAKRPRTAPSKSVAPHWLYIQDMPPSLQGLPQETLALLAGNWRRKTLLDAADDALAAALGEEADEVYLEDDPDATKFGSVFEAVKEKSGLEEQITVAISPTQELWAVGVGSQGKPRAAAAKVALATEVALYQADCGEAVDLSQLSTFAAFVEEARSAKE
ncbi:Caltractin [Symbiodinium natans]|uniref:Caltractin protein n=1 Tax=Symbiodinium natans TaxID=878477 RepID=A0A812JF64_9DINO|nr:Caltractin [Symbiodinium natans]